jgi:hypothetical protein
MTHLYIHHSNYDSSIAMIFLALVDDLSRPSLHKCRISSKLVRVREQLVIETASTASQQAQVAEIQELRRQAAAHRSAWQQLEQLEDPLLRQLEDVIITNKDRRRQLAAVAAVVDAPHKDSSIAAGAAAAVSSSTKLYLDRRESASDYLDRWLLLLESESSAAAVGEAVNIRCVYES